MVSSASPTSFQSYPPFEIEPRGNSSLRLKEQPEDFRVTELPAYEPSGEGEHLFLWVEKRGVPAMRLVTHVARALQIRPDDVGTAGMKDARAVTRQYLSVPAAAAPNPSCIETDAIRLLGAKRHGNKLKTGHLKGNRFVIRVRGAAPEHLSRGEMRAAFLRDAGMPNYFGAQRFGREGETHALGMQILRAEDPRDVPRVSRGMRRLALSAVQSALFNQALRLRREAGTLRQVCSGEVLTVVASGGPFVCDDVAIDQARLAAREVVPAGPVFGPKMRAATGAHFTWERELLASAALDDATLTREKKLMSGTRRPNLVWPSDLTLSAASEVPGAIDIAFELPSGSYATVLIGELLLGDG